MRPAPRSLLVLVLALAPRSGWAGDTKPPPAPPSLFLSGELAAGALLHAQVTAAWGKPRTAYAGLQAEALSTWEFGALATGVHGHLPFLDASVGLRHNWSYVHSALPPMATYSGLADDGRGARYSTLDASLTLYAPVPRGYAMLWTDLVHPLHTSRPVFEEYTRVVIGATGTTVDSRLGYLLPFDHERVIVGPMVEQVWIGGRDATSFRIGGMASWTLSTRWDVLAVLTAPVRSDDKLGAWDGLWGTGFARFQWDR